MAVGSRTDLRLAQPVSNEKRADIHEGLLLLGCVLVCWNFLSTTPQIQMQWDLSLAKTLADRRINSLQQYFQSLI